MGDVGEGTAVDEGGSTFQGLDQVGLQGILQEGCHGALGLQVMGGDGGAVIGVSHHHAAQALLQVGDGGGKAQNGHDLGGNGNIKAVLTGHALHTAAQAVDHVAQLTVVHVNAALPDDLLHVDTQAVALLNVVIQHGGQQVIGSADGVEVTGKVEVDVLHRHHLGIAAAGSAALDTKDRAKRGLAEGHHHVFAQLFQAVGKANGGGGFAFTCGGGIDGSHQNQLAVGLLNFLEELIVHLGLILAVQFQVLLVNTGYLCNIGNRLHGAALGDLNISQKSH